LKNKLKIHPSSKSSLHITGEKTIPTSETQLELAWLGAVAPPYLKVINSLKNGSDPTNSEMEFVMKNLCIIVLAAVGSIVMPSGAAIADQNDPRLEQLFEALGEANGDNQATAISQSIWQIWLTVDDETHQAIMNEGRLAMATSRLDIALTIFTRLIQLAPDYAEAWNRRATVYFLLGDFERSASDVAETLSLEPRHYGALSGLAQIELARSNLEEALAALETAVEVFPLMPGAKDQIDSLRIRVEGEPI
jgi:tetratricopeptide (TPR) repeat protein